jgi:DNA ligase (NAD+)
MLARLADAGVRIQSQLPAPRKQPLAGKVFVLTGSLAAMSRSAAKNRIEALGGQVASAVSRRTDCVVVGADPGSKLQKARDLGVPVIDEAAFAAILDDGLKREP